MSNTIKKAKIKGMTLEGGWEEVIYPENSSPITNDLTKKSDQLIHEDLRAAFNKLKPHLVLICDQKEDRQIKAFIENGNSLEEFDLDELPDISITGYVIGGDGEHEGVTLIGQKSTDLGVLNLISPFTKYQGEYDHGEDLAIVIDQCNFEVEQYLFKGKCAIVQMELPFDGEENPSGMTVTVIDHEGNESKPIDFNKVTKKLKKLAQESEAV